MFRRIIRGGKRRAKSAWTKVTQLRQPSGTRSSAPIQSELVQAREGIQHLRGEFTKQLSFQSFDLDAVLRAEIQELKTQLAASQKETRDRLEQSEAIVASATLEIVNTFAMELKSVGETISGEFRALGARLDQSEAIVATASVEIAASFARDLEASTASIASVAGALTALRSEVAAQFSFLEHSFNDQLRTSHTALSAASSRIEQRAIDSSNAYFDLTNRVIGLDTAICSRLNEAENSLVALRSEVAAQISFLEHGFNDQLQTSHAALSAGSSRIEQRALEISNAHFELTNRVIALDTGLNSRLNEAENSLVALRSEVGDKFGILGQGLGEQIQASFTALSTTTAAIDQRTLEIGNAQFELTNRVITLDTGLNSRLNEAENSLVALRGEVGDKFGILGQGLDEQIQASFTALSTTAAAIDQRTLEIGNAHFELTNRIVGLDTGLNSRFNAADSALLAATHRIAQTEVALQTRLNEIDASHHAQTSRTSDSLASRFVDSLSALRMEVQSLAGQLGIADLTTRVQALGNSSFELTNRVIGLDTGLNSRLNDTDNVLISLVNRLSLVEGGVLSRLNEIETHTVEALNALAPSAQGVDLPQAISVIRNELQTLATASTVSVETANRIAVLENSIQSRLNEIDNARFEGHNRLVHINSEAQTRLLELGSASTEIRNALSHLDTSIHSRLNDMLFGQLPGILEQIHAAATLQIDMTGKAARTLANGSGERAVTQRPVPTNVDDFETILDRAAKDFPAVYKMWRERLDVMGAAFAETMHGNAANAADIYSRLFRAFVERHIRGQVLDIGCGPFGRPYYLSSYPTENISGIEPLPFPPNDKIQILRGISEYLPFEDGSFSTVVSGTSLDHCLSLDKSLDEMVRVLAPGGVALLWLGSNPGAPLFDPLDPNFLPADKFHLFHFDHVWFEPILEKRFEILDRVKLDRSGYSHMFYCLRPLAQSEELQPAKRAVSRELPKGARAARGNGRKEGV